MQTKILAAVAALLVTPVAAFAYDPSVVSALAQQGIQAQSIVERGDTLRVVALDASGATYTLILDADTLQPVASTAAVRDRAFDSDRNERRGSWRGENGSDVR
jgi:hypothetical protein